MTYTITQTLPFAMAKSYRWRDRFGNFHSPEDMESRYIVHAVCMIWNHFMPHEARTHEYKPYSFGPFYTQDYMEISVRFLLRELFTRDDLEPWMKQRLRHMSEYLFRMKLVEPKEIGYDERKLI